MAAAATRWRLAALTGCATLAELAGAASRRYALGESFLGAEFFENWTFSDEVDPMNGAVEYVKYTPAFLWGLVNATSDRVYIGADMHSLSQTGSRRSVRIASKAKFNEGLFVLKVDHLPTGCGTWPSLRLVGEGPGRGRHPSGEVGIIDGVHRAIHSTTFLRTGEGCDQSAVAAGRDFSTKWTPGLTKRADNCDARAPGQFEQQGCAQSGPKRSMGSDFNAKGGGTYALEWDPAAGFIRSWFWPKGAEPGDVAGKLPDPEQWGMPYSYFRLNEQECAASHFQNMSLVFELTFCGSKGFNTYELDCPEVAHMTCEELVAVHPEFMQEAFWSLRMLDVYHRNDGSGAGPKPAGLGEQAVSAEAAAADAPAAGPAEHRAAATEASAARAAAAEARAEAAASRTSAKPEGAATAAGAAPAAAAAAASADAAFPTVRRSGKAKPGAVFGNRSTPLPTNAWWQNLALAEEPSTLEANVFQMPYVIMAGSRFVNAMQPYPVKNTTAYFAQSFSEFEAISLGSSENLSGPFVDDWDQLSVMLAWRSLSGRPGMRSPLVRGSPYITVEYDGMAPLVFSKQQLRQQDGEHRVVVDGRSVPCDGQAPLQGNIIEVELEQSDTRWMVFSPAAVDWVCSPSPFSLAASAPLVGAVRVALASGCASGAAAAFLCASGSRAAPTYPRLLRDHAGSYPAGASVDYSVAGDAGRVVWKWRVKTLHGWPTRELLQLSWPVHHARLSKELRGANSDVPAATPFHDVRGPATAVVGDSWQLDYELFPDVGLSAPRPVAQDMRAEIIRALRGREDVHWNSSLVDSQFDLPENYQAGVGDTYFAGKMLARLARVVSIADELGEAHRPYFSDLVSRLAERLEAWLSPDAQAPFLYDASWGGVVSCGCDVAACDGDGPCQPRCVQRAGPEACQALSDAGANFGNGFYNDHHYHYGYLVYAAAVVARYKPEWELRWRYQIEALARDYGNPDVADVSFPLARHMEWFTGLSYASGIAGPSFSGPSGDSSSEAVNAYYALYVYGSVVNTSFASQLRDFGRLLTAMEAHAAQTYVLARPGSLVYGDYFSEGVVGTLREHRASRRSRFGDIGLGAAGLQLLPFTPISETLVTEEWVSEHIEGYRASCAGESSCEAMGWSWVLCMAQAVVDVPGARACVQALPPGSFGWHVAAANGNSLTNSLYWIATRPLPASAAERASGHVAADEDDDVLFMKFKARGDVLDLPGSAPAWMIWQMSTMELLAVFAVGLTAVAALARTRRAAPCEDGVTRDLHIDPVPEEQRAFMQQADAAELSALQAGVLVDSSADAQEWRLARGRGSPLAVRAGWLGRRWRSTVVRREESVEQFVCA